MPARLGSVVIENVAPRIDGGAFPVKRVVGEPIEISADIFKEGHDVLAAVVRWRYVEPKETATDWEELPLSAKGNDRFTASLTPTKLGRLVFTVEAWPDVYATWASELKRKVDAGQDVKSELLEGAALLRGAAERARSSKIAWASSDAERLASAEKIVAQGQSPQSINTGLAPSVIESASRHPDRTLAVRFGAELPCIVERERARTGAWYELFPRSAARSGNRHGTFRDVEALLPEIQMMGFDVLYLPPIHPIGRTARKGKNNSTTAGPDDVGSPWAIGSAEGGHKAIHPKLGTLEDFRHLIKQASAAGIEIALDLAYQCSPDHPYLKEHPEWFQRRPDGTIKTAENPPKRYEDIVNFDFMGPGRETLWPELKSVVLHWVENGVRIFRVDNPHTKPLPFWTWLIREIHSTHPDVVFLSEAFTRPKVMKALAKAGFSQSYTYFTWRNFKAELEEYLTELTTPPVAEYMRGNLWPNTPDILPEVLQHGGPPAFKLRAALAATLSSSWGIYSSYEICEARPLHGEEYLDSEKYQLRNWDMAKAGNIRSYLAALNHIRRDNPALQHYRNLRFHVSSHEAVTFYGKSTADRTSQILVAVNMDPYAAHESVLSIPLKELGIGEDETYQVHELIQNERSLWRGPSAHVRLTPENPAAIWRVLRFARSEHSFDYYD